MCAEFPRWSGELVPPPTEPLAASLLPDYVQAEQFLKELDPTATTFTFQTFDDNKKRKNKKLARIIHGSFAQVRTELTRLNEQGAGIFVMVQKGDDKGRSNDNVTAIRAVFQEDDGGGKPLPLTPQIVTESSPGKFHRYIKAEGLSLSDFDGVQRRLVDDFGSDPNAKDRARVLRVPGFFHRKREPHMVRLISVEPNPPYSRKQVLNALPPVPVNPPKKENKSEKEEINWTQIRAAAKHIPPDDYGTWLKMGMAIHWAGEKSGDLERARAEWDEWSQQSKKFDSQIQERTWRGFSTERDKVVTVASIFAMVPGDDVYEALARIETKPKTTWKLKVKGKWLRLNTAQLDTHRQVRREALDQIGEVLDGMNARKWNAILKGLMAKVTIEKIDGNDLTEEGVIWEQILSFLTQRARAKANDELLQDKPWFDDENERVYFRTKGLLHHLRCQHNYSTPTAVCLVLRDKGGLATTLSLKGATVRVWWLPLEAVESAIQTEEFTVHKLSKESF
jgi:hypothetical protein